MRLPSQRTTPWSTSAKNGGGPMQVRLLWRQFVSLLSYSEINEVFFSLLSELKLVPASPVTWQTLTIAQEIYELAVMGSVAFMVGVIPARETGVKRCRVPSYPYRSTP